MPNKINDLAPSTKSAYKAAHKAAYQSSLLPYSGTLLANPEYKDHTPNTQSKFCSIDFSGKVTYRYNSLGFRGEDYNKDAKFHIFICGASEDFGAGLEQQDLWSHKLKLRYASEKGVAPSEVNLINFSQNGASMDYITRVVLSQCKRVKPDLMIAAITPSARTEYFSDEISRSYSGKPFTITSAVYAAFLHQDKYKILQERTQSFDQNEKDELFDALEGYYSYYTTPMGLINRLKNIILMQQFCNNYSIPLTLWSLREYGLDKELNLPLADSVKALSNSVNYSYIYQHDELDPEHLKAADDRHPGADVHTDIAENFWLFYKGLFNE